MIETKLPLFYIKIFGITDWTLLVWNQPIKIEKKTKLLNQRIDNMIIKHNNRMISHIYPN